MRGRLEPQKGPVPRGLILTPRRAPRHLQEVISHCKKLTNKNKEQLSGMMVLDKQKGLKSLSKEKRQKLEAYQHLFYLLQVSRILWNERTPPSPGGLGPGGLSVPVTLMP